MQELMPKASVDKNHFLAPYESQIGLSWKVFAVQPEAKSHSVDETPNLKFRLHPLTSDPPHIFTSSLRRDGIHRLPLNTTEQECSNPNQSYCNDIWRALR
jgi:hypothetical protein